MNMSTQKGSFKDRLRFNRILKINFDKRKKKEEDLEVREKEVKELTKMKEIISLKQVVNDNSANTTKINAEVSQNSIPISKAIPIVSKSKIISEEKIYIKDKNSGNELHFNQDKKNNIVYIPSNDDDIEIITEEEIMAFNEVIEKRLETDEIAIKIEKKVNKFIEKSKEEVIQLKELTNKVINSEEAITEEQIIKKEQLLLELKQRIDNLRKQYDIIYQNYDFTNIDEIGNEISDLVEQYKFKIDSSVVVESLANECRKELNKMESIIDLADLADKGKTSVLDNKEKIKERALHFARHKTSVEDTNEIKNKIDDSIKTQEQEISKIIKKLKNFESQEDEYIIKNLEKMSRTTLLMYFSFNMMPKFLSALIGGMLLNNLIRGMRNLNSTNNKKIIYFTYERYEISIKDEMRNLRSIGNLIGDSLNQIDYLKHEFEYNFWQYKNDIPEYDLIYNRLLLMEKGLIDKLEKIEKMDVSLNEEKEKILTKKINLNE